MCLLAIVQEIAAIYAFTKMCSFIDEKFKTKWITILSLLFFAIFPYNQLMPLMTTKDSLFTSMFIISIINIYNITEQSFRELSKDEKICKIIICAIELIFTLLLRTNFKYALLVLIIFILIFARKSKKELLIIGIVSIVLSTIINQILMTMLNPEKLAEREKYNIFAQSVGNIVNKKEDDLTDDEKSQIEKYYIGTIDEIKKSYSERLSDPIKNRVDLNTVSKDRIGYFKFSLSLILKYKNESIESFFNTNRGYFDFTDETFGKIYPHNENRGIFELYTIVLRPISEIKKEEENVSSYINPKLLDGDDIDTYRVHEFNLLEPVKNAYKFMFTENEVLKIPILNIIFKPATYFYITIIALIYSVIKKKNQYTLILGLTTLYMATLLLGPCVLIRYIYPMIAILPLTLSVFKNEDKQENNKNEQAK